VHRQGPHQPHDALRRREAQLHLPRGHPVRTRGSRLLAAPARSSPALLAFRFLDERG
jgi:hypothetical protein